MIERLLQISVWVLSLYFLSKGIEITLRVQKNAVSDRTTALLFGILFIVIGLGADLGAGFWMLKSL